MKNISYTLVGILFGIVMTKSEAISWFRIQEMFRFQSFHMYGIIGVAVICGLILVQLVKRGKIKGFNGALIEIADKQQNYKAAILGGTVFGLGWALTGACPGPLYVLLGSGYGAILFVILSAMIGAFCYGVFRHRLPH